MLARQLLSVSAGRMGQQLCSLWRPCDGMMMTTLAPAFGASSAKLIQMLPQRNVMTVTFCANKDTKAVKPTTPPPKTPPPAPVATYEEVLALPKHPEKLLVDVREPQELLDTGVIPTSINVPLGEVATAFSAATSPKQFKARFGRVKPDADVSLIFMCKIGGRSEAAAQMAIEMGYKNVKNYRGSWLDWAERNKLPK